MITKTDTGVVVSCNDCSNEKELPFSGLDRVRKWLADHGWVTLLRSGEDQHCCPLCARKKSAAQTAPLRLPIAPR